MDYLVVGGPVCNLVISSFLIPRSEECIIHSASMQKGRELMSEPMKYE